MHRRIFSWEFAVFVSHTCVSFRRFPLCEQGRRGCSRGELQWEKDRRRMFNASACLCKDVLPQAHLFKWLPGYVHWLIETLPRVEESNSRRTKRRLQRGLVGGGGRQRQLLQRTQVRSFKMWFCARDSRTYSYVPSQCWGWVFYTLRPFKKTKKKNYMKTFYHHLIIFTTIFDWLLIWNP